MGRTWVRSSLKRPFYGRTRLAPKERPKAVYKIRPQIILCPQNNYTIHRHSRRNSLSPMPPRHILSPQAHAALFDPPTDPAAIVRHYTFSPDDMALIRQRRRVANRIGFAINLAYLRFPGRVLGVGEMPPADMLAFIAGQIGCDRADFGVKQNAPLAQMLDHGGYNDVASIRARRLLDRNITELFAEVHGWTGFADRFAHLRTGAPPDDVRALMTAVLADATNLGLTRMARSAGAFSHSRLLWVAEWHVRDETYQSALACLVDAIHAQPFTRIWGDGDT